MRISPDLYLSSISTSSMVSVPLFFSARAAPAGWTAKSPARKASCWSGKPEVLVVSNPPRTTTRMPLSPKERIDPAPGSVAKRAAVGCRESARIGAQRRVTGSHFPGASSGVAPRR